MMTLGVEQDVSATLEELRTAWREFHEALGVPNSPPPLPPPASEAAITRLEQRLGNPLPPMYRAFLLLQDGWPELDSEVSILSVAEMGELREGREKEILARIVEETDLREARDWLIFGLSPRSASSYLFDPTQPDAAGEWPVVEYDEMGGVEQRHPNFTAFLRSTAAEAAEARDEAKQGQDLQDMDF